LSNPDYQIGEGCLIDQLVGQYMAHICGLGYLHAPEHVRTTLQSVYALNRRTDMFDHFNTMRSFAVGDEPALLMAAFPEGKRPPVPFPYYTEVMTGFEYTAAAGMLYEGLQEEGLQCIQDVRSRFDGAKRSPFDEAECGHHYARGMASWAAVLAWTGFQYSAVERSLKIDNRPGRYFWSTGGAWGSYCLTQSGVVSELSIDTQTALALRMISVGDHIVEGDWKADREHPIVVKW